MDTKKLTKLSLLTAIALIMFIIELRLPSLCPINGVKLGLANIVTVYAVYQFKPSEVAMLHFTRIILGAMFSGNVSTLLYSLSGGILCYIGMVLLKNVVPMKHMWIVSIVGAILHNTGQMIMAVIVMGSFTVLSYYPILIFSGCIAGFFTAMCAQYIIKKGALKSNESNIV
jgi:heptaprenyl diphosphate synthase